MHDSDWQYLWAAYGMGMWDDLFEPGMAKDEFRDEIMSWLCTVDMDWMLEAEHEGKVRPVGLVLGWLRPGQRAIEPHVNWMPWASTRIKFESLANYLLHVRKEYKVFVYASEEDERFWRKLCQHRVIGRVAKINDYFAPGEPAIEYCTQGPFV